MDTVSTQSSRGHGRGGRGNRGNYRGGKGGHGGRGGRGSYNNQNQTPVTLNEITKFIKHNKSAIQYQLDVVPDFEQSFTIPQKVVSDETYYPEKDFEAHLHKEKDTTAIYYEADSIISLPNNLSKTVDLNLFYSYGLLNTHTLPYSVLYQIHDEFKFMSDVEKRRCYDAIVEKLVTQCLESKILKGVAIQKTQKSLLDNDWSTKLLEFALKTEFDSVNVLIINLDDNNVMYSFEEEDRDKNVIMFYCNSYYYPLVHMYSEAHSNELLSNIKKQFSS